MGGRSSRTKGHAFERYIAQRLRPYDKTCMRNVGESQLASVDIITKLPFGIQCKRMCTWPEPFKVYNQALGGIRAARLNGTIPIGVVKVDREQRIVCLMAKTHFRVFFCDLLKYRKFKLVRRRRLVSIPKGKPRKYFVAKKRKISYQKSNPAVLLYQAFDLCKSDEHPLAVWTNLEKVSKKLRTLYCFDFELLLQQIEKVYGKEEDSSCNLQR